MRAFLVAEPRAEQVRVLLDGRGIDFEEGDALTYFDSPDSLDDFGETPSQLPSVIRHFASCATIAWAFWIVLTVLR